jgi:hypothetical protein
MAMKAIFSETLDTVRTESHDVALAEAMLKLQAISPPGAVISATHATDSPMLLSKHIAGEAGFQTLIKNGRIRITRWPKGQGARKIFTDNLNSTTFRFSGWPEFTDDPAIQAAANEVWNKRISSTGVGVIDERLDLADQLFDAAETADKNFGEIKERPRRNLFENLLARAPLDLPDEGTPPAVKAAALELAEYEERGNRSKVYDWIDQRHISRHDQLLLKDMVDARYNMTVAYSLNQPFLSARRVWKNLRPTPYELITSPTELALLEPLDARSTLGPIEWNTLAQILRPYSGEQLGKTEALSIFEYLISHIAIYEQKLAVAAMVVTAGVYTINAVLDGGANAWALTSLQQFFDLTEKLITGGSIGARLGSTLTHRWRVKQLRAYSGWLDATEPVVPDN